MRCYPAMCQSWAEVFPASVALRKKNTGYQLILYFSHLFKDPFKRFLEKYEFPKCCPLFRTLNVSKWIYKIIHLEFLKTKLANYPYCCKRQVANGLDIV